MKMNILIGAVALLVLLSVYQSYQITELKNRAIAAPAGVSASGAIDMTGWDDNEKMQYEHHGTLPARLQGQADPQQPSGAGMVGGC